MSRDRRSLVLRYCYPLRTWERQIDARIAVDTYFANERRRAADWAAGFVVIDGKEYARP